MKTRHFILGVLLAAALQSAALGKILYDRASLLKTGQEVVLETGFVDPRDLFRGHYTSLDFPISRVDPKTIPMPDNINYNDDLFLELDTESGPFATIRAITKTYPKAAQGPVLKAKAKSDYSKSGEMPGRFHIEFPFDRYFAPKMRAQELEKLERDRKLGVILALDSKGKGAIKGISIDGRKIYEEPLF